MSDIPGTTQRLIRESIEMDGFQINLIDTAGIDEPGDEIERIGISLSRKKIAEASIVLMVIDGLRGLDERDRAILEEIGDRRVIIIINKLDAAGTERVAVIESSCAGHGFVFRRKRRRSARSGESVGDMLRGEFVDVDSSSLRHEGEDFSRALESARRVMELLGGRSLRRSWPLSCRPSGCWVR